MNSQLLLAIGGVGLFLLGMLVLTDGLRNLAGNTLRRVLARFTRSPLSGAVTGALTTAVVQSSSATTVTAVGFVGAGLLTFPHALGIIFGANIGTTMTGWLVAIVGFKLELGVIVLPLVLVGVLCKMFARGWLSHLGWAIAGFSLLFIGIDAMQQGLASYQGTVTPDDFPDDTLFGRFQLVLIGVAITLVTQSSSAGVAAALVALGSGTISFPQAAAMVIGMDVGTTLTAALATVGGSAAMRQTGYAHVIYNIMTGLLAFFLLGPFAAAADAWTSGGSGDPQIAVVAFHTTFNTLGVILAVLFTRPFSDLITRLVPERGPVLVRRLDKRLLGDAGASADAALATIRDVAFELFDILTELLDPTKRAHADPDRLRNIEHALTAARGFVEQIKTGPSQPPAHRRHVASMHALDHLTRLSHRCTQTARLETSQSDRRLRRLSNVLRTVLISLPSYTDLNDAAQKMDRLRALLREQRRSFRKQTVIEASLQRIGAERALKRLDSIRWLHRVAYHVWRILHHLDRGKEGAKELPEVSEPEVELREERDDG